jgi:hypothetical protein
VLIYPVSRERLQTIARWYPQKGQSRGGVDQIEFPFGPSGHVAR